MSTKVERSCGAQRRTRENVRLALAVSLALAPLASALAEIKPLVDFRLRSESVEQTPFANEADVTTLRGRLGVEVGKLWSTAFLIEGEGVTPLNGDYRPDTSVANMTTFPVIPDPEGYEINRLQLTNTSLPGTALTLGRQRINLDDQRFMGNSGWRQNEQTYDGFRVVNKSVKNLSIDAAYFNQANRFFGPESPQGRYEGDNFYANLGYQTPIGKLSGFAYVFDFDTLTRFPGLTAGQAAALNPVRASTETYGVRIAGDRALGKVKLGYNASYADQKSLQNNPLDFSLSYRLAEVTAGYRVFTFGLGQELMEGNGTVGFATPMSTLHKFQGWADKFLTTPANGMDDRYASLGVATKKLGMFDSFSASVVYHSYATDRMSIDLGSEVNLQLQAKWKRFVARQVCDYSAQAGETPAIYRDTSKLWAQLDFVW
ncbi:MAG: hypothetical protein HC872_05440 [Gammaproteobacteria bacterium]|nr:hypothetical protein [Gammaproteobacteria bacterium]